MKFRFRYIYGLFILSFGILTVLAFLFYKRLQESNTASNQVEHNYETMYLLSQVDSYLKDVINAESELLLTGDSAHLADALDNAVRIKPMLDTIHRLVIQTGNQEVNFIKLQGLILTRLLMVKDNVGKAVRNLSRESLQERLTKARVIMNDYQPLYDQILTTESRIKTERDSQKATGQRKTPTLLFAIFIFSAISLVISFVFIIRELTKRLEFQHQLQQQVGSLNRANAELEQLTNIASHHLQEPLRKIQTFGNQIVSRHKELPDEVKLLLGKMDLAAKHMHGLTRDMVRYSSLINTQETLMQIDLNYVLLKAAEHMDEKLTLRQGKLVIANTLPVIKGIPTQLVILFEQLIDNSIQFARPDTPPLITVTNETPDSQKISDKITALLGGTTYYKITIADNGMGFDNKYVEKMFYLFQQLESPRGLYQNKGIGLPMVQRIMINHGGNVSATGTAGEGAVFILYFPIAH